MVTSAGLLAHDPDRWLLFKAPHDLPRKKLAAWLTRSQLLAESPAQPVRPRTEQWFGVAPAWTPPSGLEARPGARFSCAGCGAVCRDFRLGPLPLSDVEALLSLPMSEEHPADRLFARRDGSPLPAAEARVSHGKVFLRREQNGCVLLLPDGRCSVHARFGAEKKPLMCRLFPFEFLSTPKAVRVGLRMDECASADRASHGRMVEEQLPELRGLFDLCDTVRLVPPRLWLTPERLVRFDELVERQAGIEHELATPDSQLRPRARMTIGCAPWMAALFRLICEWGGAPAPHPDATALERLIEATLAQAEVPLHPSPQRSPTALYILSRRGGAASRPALPPESAALEMLLSAEALELERRLVTDDLWTLRLLDGPDLRAGAALSVLRYTLSRRLAGRLAAVAGAAMVRPTDLIQAQLSIEKLEVEKAVPGASIESLAALVLVEAGS